MVPAYESYGGPAVVTECSKATVSGVASVVYRSAPWCVVSGDSCSYVVSSAYDVAKYPSKPSAYSGASIPTLAAGGSPYALPFGDSRGPAGWL